MSDMRVAARRLRRFAEAGGFDELCERHGVAVLVAFGSAVRDDETQARDLDIAVAFLDRDRTDVLALIDDLAAACSPAEIDLMDLGRASPVARERALVGGVPLYERERGDYARAADRGHRRADGYRVVAAARAGHPCAVTPREFDPEVVQAKLRFLDELQRDLAGLGEISADRLSSDRVVRHALEQYRQYVRSVARFLAERGPPTT